MGVNIRITLLALHWFLLFFQCSAFSFSPLYITPETLLEYATCLPDPKAQEWIDHNADFLAYLARMPYPLCSWQDKYANGNWHLFKRGIKNHGYTNYIFQIPRTDYWVQIGGPKHRVRNIYAFNTRKNSYYYAEIAKHWEFRNNELLDSFELMPTYQTASRFAYYLLLERALEQLPCEHIRIAPTYLVHIPGYNTHVCDEHYIVIQQHMPDLVRLRDMPELIHQVPDQAINELFQLICNTGYWNIKNGLYIDSEYNLVLLDYEQRNIENPEDFFLKDLGAFEECILNGINELALVHLKPHSQRHYKHLLWLIATDTLLPHLAIWPNCIQIIEFN